MRTEYPPWEYIGYSQSAMKCAIEHIERDRTEEAVKSLKDALVEYGKMAKINLGKDGVLE